MVVSYKSDLERRGGEADGHGDGSRDGNASGETSGRAEGQRIHRVPPRMWNSNQARKNLFGFALAPKWLEARINATVGAFDGMLTKMGRRSRYAHVGAGLGPEAQGILQPAAREASRNMLSKGFGASLVFANVMQYLTSGTFTTSNAVGREMDIRVGDMYISNPFFTFERPMMKVFGAAMSETGKLLGVGKERPGSSVQTVLRQMFSLGNPLFPLGQNIMTNKSMQGSTIYDPAAPAHEQMLDLAKYQAGQTMPLPFDVLGVSSDPATFGMRESTAKRFLGFFGAGMAKADPLREAAGPLQKSKAFVMERHKGEIEHHLQKAKRAQDDPEEFEKHIKAAISVNQKGRKMDKRLSQAMLMGDDGTVYQHLADGKYRLDDKQFERLYAKVFDKYQQSYKRIDKQFREDIVPPLQDRFEQEADAQKRLDNTPVMESVVSRLKKESRSR